MVVYRTRAAVLAIFLYAAVQFNCIRLVPNIFQTCAKYRARLHVMLKPDDIPTPWRHPKHGTYSLKKRVPQDIKHLWTKADPYQISLGTKDASKAHDAICKAWLTLQGEFADLRKKAAQG